MEMKRIRRWGKTVVGDLVVGKIGAASSSEVNSLGNYLEKEAEEKKDLLVTSAAATSARDTSPGSTNYKCQWVVKSRSLKEFFRVNLRYARYLRFYWLFQSFDN